MYGIFTYKTGCFLGQMLVNIPAPWSIWVSSMEVPLVLIRMIFGSRKSFINVTRKDGSDSVTSRDTSAGAATWATFLPGSSWFILSMGDLQDPIDGGTYHIFLAYFSGLCKGISPQNMAWKMVQYLSLHFRILEISHWFLGGIIPKWPPVSGEWITGWWWLEPWNFEWLSIWLGIIKIQLTSIFFRGVGQPPTRLWWFAQMIYSDFHGD